MSHYWEHILWKPWKIPIKPYFQLVWKKKLERLGRVCAIRKFVFPCELLRKLQQNCWRFYSTITFMHSKTTRTSLPCYSAWLDATTKPCVVHCKITFHFVWSQPAEDNSAETEVTKRHEIKCQTNRKSNRSTSLQVTFSSRCKKKKKKICWGSYKKKQTSFKANKKSFTNREFCL